MKALPKFRKRLGGNKTILIPLGLAVLTIWLRLADLTGLPPGLHPLEAELGIKAQSAKIITSLDQIQSLLSSIVAKIGLSFNEYRPILGIRVGFAIASLSSAFFLYQWIKLTYGRRPAIIGATFMATLPLALNLSRFAGGYALVLVFGSAALYFLTKFWQKPKAHTLVGLVLSLAGGIYSHSSFNWFVLGLALVAILNLPAVRKFKAKRTVKGMISLLAYLLVAAPAAPAVLKYFSNLSFNGSISRLAEFSRAIILRSTGDGSFSLGGVPLLNAFVGLMLILGLMVVTSNLKRFANRVVLIMFLTSLLPYMLLATDVPFADRVVMFVIPALALAAIGTDYLLSQWHKTFPINSAARQAGSIMIVALIFFSARHGYNQYFLAWKATSETKRNFAYQTVDATQFANTVEFSGERYLVGTNAEIKVAEFLKAPQLQLITPTSIKKLPKLKGPRQFILLPSSKESSIDVLAKSFPGGKLKPELDAQKNELFLIYTVKP